ncbi:TetR/AcrR family transcriptional regulator [Protofrankia symbiont of Coriaria ruscifolia]|uniref:Regulatory protein TetR n=1 Tax=Candidatus Protofrankia californiensis TaxID=1839754 RepID=A0A1C3NZT9_9ACTN|nr:TetR/AcrR family transcriptional regulator [Protofrankia symbiont of Coriaria ruscifolia]SBW23045.1 regulatory protein TetR [Candidatus Protofrankia californiensis]
METAQPRHTRTPRGTLSQQLLLDTAMEIVDIGGVGGFSMRALGARLNIDPTAVYRHFRTKNELLEALADRVVRGDEPLPHTGDPRADIRETFAQLRRSLLRHPTLAPIVLRRPPGGEASWERTNHAIGLLRDAGLPDRQASDAYTTLLFYTLGHALTEARHTAATIAKKGLDATVTPITAISSSASRYPHLAAVADHLAADMQAQFHDGLSLILAALAI